MLEQKIAAAKQKRHKQYLKLVIAFTSVTLVCGSVIFFLSCCQISFKEDDSIFPEFSKDSGVKASVSTPTPIQTSKQIAIPSVADEQLRLSYIKALSEYENNTKPKLEKIDLVNWDKPGANRLIVLENDTLTKFSLSDYAGALSSIDELSQLAQKMIADSQQQFSESLANAKSSYETDDYENAKSDIEKALILDNTSGAATILSKKINTLSEILPLLEKIDTAKVENNHEKELSLIKDLIKRVPERKSAIMRKQVLISLVNNKNFNSYVSQSYKAIKYSDATKAKQKLNAAKNIFPTRQEITDVTLALQALEKKQRLETYLHAAQSAMAADDWVIAKQQLELALQEQKNDKLIQKALFDATTIIKLKNEFNQNTSNPYRLSNKHLVSKAKKQLALAETYISVSPSLSSKANDLSHLIDKMSVKISVTVTSDNQTNILVRGVGVVGVTQLKVIQLTPGHYKFEGKRAGYKSKLMEVLIPYDKPDYQINIVCDEAI